VKELVLAIDLGTSSIKLLAVDSAGRIIARARLPHDTLHVTPDAAEQDPGHWWASIQKGIRAIVRDAGSDGTIAAIGVTGQMHGLVIHNVDGTLPHPALIWQDRRSATSVATLRRLVSALAASRISAGFQAASWHWLMLEEPDMVKRIARILLPKDEIIYRLTGEHVTDPSDAIGSGWFDPVAGTWDEATIAAAGANRDMLPRIIPSGTIAGALGPESAEAVGLDVGIPVVIAGGDAATAAFGAGATETSPLLLLSTGCQVLHPCSMRPETDFWPSALPAGMPQWLRVAATRNGGNVLDWARARFGPPSVAPVPDLVFLPYLAGERSEHIISDAAGAFCGLREHHGTPEMARAVVDGVALAVADAFAQIGGELGSEDPIFVGGGGARDAALLEGVTCAFDRPLEVIAEASLSAWGAARSVAVALDWIDPGTDPAAWRAAAHPVQPSRGNREMARERLSRFRDTAQRLYGVDP
jgi:xylulokinase